jgi:iron-sulfur cluster repair protein YtfE (RIC family)
MAAKVSRVHGAKAPHLLRVGTIVAELSAMHMHLHLENNVLFRQALALDTPLRPASRSLETSQVKQ